MRTLNLNGALVLMYHRVTELQSDPFSIAVTPAHFEEHLQCLKENYTPVPLNALVDSISKGISIDGAVAITFDDGYRDIKDRAWELLRRFKVPATCFVVTGYVGNNHEFMWDELDRILLEPKSLPKHFRLSLDDQTLEWDEEQWTNDLEEPYVGANPWKFEEGNDPTARHKLYRKLYYPLKYWDESKRWHILEQLRHWAGVAAHVRPSHRIMVPADISELARDGLIEIGAHSVTHPVLAELPFEVQQREIIGSKKFLEELLGLEIRGFSYPYGDFTPDTKAILRENGFEYACATLNSPVRYSADPFQLPRVNVRDCGGDEFAAHLHSFFL